ncbi:hypothetical protein C8R43DRAFT_1235725 [Mycena crocata]|nr:hypothetical protein C8R43DRAFT_1235725 [Mycena crocata]
MTTVHSVPRRGAFAAMRIDPYATLAHLDDPQIRAICEASGVGHKQYIVYVTDGDGKMYDPLARLHQHTVEFLIRGQPPTVATACVDASMSMPVYPAMSHPLQRVPLRTSTPMPWGDSYLSPFVTADVLCGSSISHDPIPHHVDIPDQLRHDMHMAQDTRRREEGVAFRASLPPAVCASVCTSGTDDGWDEGVVASENDALFDHHDSDVEDDDPNLATHSHLDLIDVIRFCTNPQAPRWLPTVVTFTHDLSGVADVLPAYQFFKEEAQLRSLYEKIVANIRLRAQNAQEEAELSRSEAALAEKMRRRKKAPVVRVISGIGRQGKDALDRILRPSRTNTPPAAEPSGKAF